MYKNPPNEGTAARTDDQKKKANNSKQQILQYTKFEDMWLCVFPVLL